MEKHTMERNRSWIGLPRAWTSIMWGVISAQNRTKGTQTSKKYFESPSKTLKNDVLKKLQRSLSNRVQVAMKNKTGHNE